MARQQSIVVEGGSAHLQRRVLNPRLLGTVRDRASESDLTSRTLHLPDKSLKERALAAPASLISLAPQKSTRERRTRLAQRSRKVDLGG